MIDCRTVRSLLAHHRPNWKTAEVCFLGKGRSWEVFKVEYGRDGTDQRLCSVVRVRNDIVGHFLFVPDCAGYVEGVMPSGMTSAAGGSFSLTMHDYVDGTTISDTPNHDFWWLSSLINKLTVLHRHRSEPYPPPYFTNDWWVGEIGGEFKKAAEYVARHNLMDQKEIGKALEVKLSSPDGKS